MEIKLKTFFLLFSCYLSLFSLSASAEEQSNASFEHIDVEMLSDQGSDSSDPKLGVHFKIETGWHIYAKNPGDVGLPTVVKWNVPEGTKIREPIWPAPKEFHADGLTSYGYENELTLTSELIATENKDNEIKNNLYPLNAKAEVEWLLCKDECIPGQVTLNKPMMLRFPTAKLSDNLSQGIGTSKTDYLSFTLSLCLAFIGGILLNLMPCVFPVLSLKILSFVNQTDTKRALRHGAVFASGIILSFWVLSGMLIVVRAFGSKVGWGFQFQSPTFVILMGFLIFSVALNLLGVFEIGLTAQRIAGRADRKSGYLGSFFSGVLSTLLATPCSAPFMASAIAAALVLPLWMAFLVFTAIGLGMSAPYLLLSAFPRWLNFLPRPGAWMLRLKQIMAFPMFATVIWLVWVLSVQVGSVGLINFLIGLLCLSIGFWTMGQWYQPGARTHHRRLALATFALSVISASAIALPIDFISDGVAHSITNAKEEIPTEPYSETRLTELVSSQKPVLVEFSAAWCLTCQINHLLLFRSEKVRQALNDKGIVLLVGDWTKRDSVITQAINSLGREGVPLSALYLPGKNQPLVLPQILTVDGLLGALKDIPDRVI